MVTKLDRNIVIITVIIVMSLLIIYELVMVPYLVTQFNCEQLANNFHKELAVIEYKMRCWT